MPRLLDWKQQFRKELESQMQGAELESCFKQLAAHVLGLSYNAVNLNLDRELSQAESIKLNLFSRRLKAGEPVQYVVGYTEFLDLNIKVNPAALIPRPETEELVLTVVDKLGKSFSGDIIDIGTGTGCIALAVKHLLPKSKVTALDVSAAAIALAKENAQKLDLDIHFLTEDMDQHDFMEYDVVVSNPPYIGYEEEAEIDRSALKHEPHLALFSKDPNYFYRRIIEKAAKSAKTKCVFFELNPHYAAEVRKMAQEAGFKQSEIIVDFYGKQRILFASKT